MLKHAILGFLSYGEMSGYDLKSQMDVSTGFFWHARISQIYATLKTLETEGLAISRVEEQVGRPDKRLYRITNVGTNELRTWLNTPHTEIDPRKETLMLRIFFSAKADKQKLLAQLQIQRDLHERQAHHYRDVTAAAIQRTAEHNPELKRDALLWEFTRKFGERYETMYAEWLAELSETAQRDL